MIRTDAIDSLTAFQKDVKNYVNRLETSGEALVLTVNGKAKLVVQDAAAYQSLLDEVEKSRFAEAVRIGIKEANQGLGRPAATVFEDMKAKYGL